MNCIKIIYKEENGKVTINEVDKYINKQGIWALFGKREDIFECLNVGKCIDVGREILYDISCLHNILLHKEGNEEYINQFAELCNFLVFCHVLASFSDSLHPNNDWPFGHLNGSQRRHVN